MSKWKFIVYCYLIIFFTIAKSYGQIPVKGGTITAIDNDGVSDLKKTLMVYDKPNSTRNFASIVLDVGEAKPVSEIIFVNRKTANSNVSAKKIVVKVATEEPIGNLSPFNSSYYARTIYDGLILPDKKENSLKRSIKFDRPISRRYYLIEFKSNFIADISKDNPNIQFSNIDIVTVDTSETVRVGNDKISIKSTVVYPVKNLVLNPDFERNSKSRPEFWGYTSADMTQFDFGTQKDKKGNSYGWIISRCSDNSAYFKQVIKVTPETKYFVKVDYCSVAGGGLVWMHNSPFDQRIWVKGNSKNSQYFDGFVNPQYFSGNNKWNEYIKEITTPKNLHEFTFAIGAYFQPGLVLYDNVFFGLAETDLDINIKIPQIKTVRVLTGTEKIFEKRFTDKYPGKYNFTLFKASTYKKYIVEVISAANKGIHYRRSFPDKFPWTTRDKTEITTSSLPPQYMTSGSFEDSNTKFNPKSILNDKKISVSNIKTFGKEVKITGGGISLQINKHDSFNIIGKSALKISEYNKGNINFSITNIEVDEKNKEVTANSSSDSKLTSTHSLQALSKGLIWQMSFKNTSQKQRLLEVSVILPVANKKNSQIWDGLRYHSTMGEAHERNSNVPTMPIQFHFSNEIGTAIGLWPLQWCSQYSAKYSPDSNSMTGKLQYSARIVIDPGKTENIKFVFYKFIPRWGILSGLQQYTDICPHAFYPAPNIDPNILKTGGYIHSSVFSRKLSWEEARRMGLGFDWSYAPFQTTGDWYPDKKYWQDKKGCPGKSDLHSNTCKSFSLEDYKKVLYNRFDMSFPGYATMYYILPYAVDVSLADTIYKNDRWTEANGKFSPNKGQWVKNDDFIRFVYPWGNQYAQAVKEDIRQILEEFHASGFAFDEAYGILPHYGSGINDSPGRGWDDKGKIFVRQGVALGKLADYIHSFNTKGYRAGLVLNNVLNYMIAFRGDAAIFEPHIWDSLDRFMQYRYRMGSKPITSWAVWKKISHGIDWEKIHTAKEKEKTLIALSDYLWLMGLRYNAHSYSLVNRGVKRIVNGKEIVYELNKLGWQVEPGITGDSRLWFSRYGKNTDSICVVSNPSREKIVSNLQIFSACLDEGTYLPVDYTGNRIFFTASGKQTELKASLKPKEVSAIRTIAAIKARVLVKGESEMSLIALKPSHMFFRFTCNKPGKYPIQYSSPNGYQIEKIILNGKEVEASVKNGVLKSKTFLSANNELTIGLQPRNFLVGEKLGITEFKYVSSQKKPMCTILYPANSGIENKRLAEWISQYFEYWYWRQKAPGTAAIWSADKTLLESEKVAIPVLEHKKINNAAWIIVTNNKLSEMTIKSHLKLAEEYLRKKRRDSVIMGLPGVIVIIAVNKKALRSGLMSFFGILDIKYPWWGSFGTFAGPPVMKEINLPDGVINTKASLNPLQQL